MKTIEGPARDQLLASLARRPATITPAESQARNACVAAEVQRVIADMRARPDYWAGSRQSPRPVSDEQWDYDMQCGGLWAV